MENHNVHTAEIRDKINNEKAARKEPLQRRKLLQEELNMVGAKTKAPWPVVRVRPTQGNGLQASSSGRVASTSKGEAREIANSYLTSDLHQMLHQCTRISRSIARHYGDIRR